MNIMLQIAFFFLFNALLHANIGQMPGLTNSSKLSQGSRANVCYALAMVFLGFALIGEGYKWLTT